MPPATPKQLKSVIGHDQLMVPEFRIQYRGPGQVSVGNYHPLTMRIQKVPCVAEQTGAPIFALAMIDMKGRVADHQVKTTGQSFEAIPGEDLSVEVVGGERLTGSGEREGICVGQGHGEFRDCRQERRAEDPGPTSEIKGVLRISALEKARQGVQEQVRRRVQAAMGKHARIAPDAEAVPERLEGPVSCIAVKFKGGVPSRLGGFVQHTVPGRILLAHGMKPGRELIQCAFGACAIFSGHPQRVLVTHCAGKGMHQHLKSLLLPRQAQDDVSANFQIWDAPELRLEPLRIEGRPDAFVLHETDAIASFPDQGRGKIRRGKKPERGLKRMDRVFLALQELGERRHGRPMSVRLVIADEIMGI